MKPATPQSAILLAISYLSFFTLPAIHAATINVQVGGPGVLKYNPQFVNASIGDVIRFNFQQKNHTATQSTLENPCARGPNGFDSGFIPVADSVTSGFPIAELSIKDTTPIWVYCRQGNHCQQGMVFAVNPGDKFPAFLAAATGGTAPSVTPIASPVPSIVTVTATVTVSGQPLTTTYGSFPGSAAPTNAAPVDHKVIVGGPGKLTYDPSNITAQIGDTVTFEFRQKNHTVTASSFDAPCRALSLTSNGAAVGFDSGFMPVTDGATTFPTYTIRINDTKPIWAYCRQPSHCGQGMVFAANAIESGPNNFANFRAKAMQLNGTGSSTSPSSSSSASASTPSATVRNGASVLGIHGAGIVTIVGVLFTLFW